MTDVLPTRIDNTSCPMYHRISIDHLDFVVIDWAEKFFDRAVLPCRTWMDPDAYQVIDADAKRLRVAAIEGDLQEMKRIASSVLNRCAAEFMRFDERRKAQVEVGLN